jgi:beta-mannosidase
MFRRYEVPVKFKTSNELQINFTSSVKHDLLKEKEFNDEYGFSLPQNYSFTRKAAYQYGWDWGPRILSVGIWKDVSVLIYNDAKIDNVRFEHSPITKTTKAIECGLKTDLIQLDKNVEYNFTVQAKRKANNATLFSDSFTIKDTVLTQLDIPFTLTNNIWENVWWTWDLGQPNLISISLKLVNVKTQETIDYALTTGIRTVTVIQESKTYNGTSFTFNLNGYDVYMRGGNYIPPEMSLARTTRQTYEKVRDNALFARFNMLRLWGGGQYEKD